MIEVTPTGIWLSHKMCVSKFLTIDDLTYGRFTWRDAMAMINFLKMESEVYRRIRLLIMSPSNSEEEDLGKLMAGGMVREKYYSVEEKVKRKRTKKVV